MKGICVIGTDTDVGKTIISAAIVAGLKAVGLEVGVMKPIETGDGDDGRFLLSMARENDRREHHSGAGEPGVCAYRFSMPAAPYIAAFKEGIEIKPEKIYTLYNRITERHNITIVEGVGGIAVPLGDNFFLYDLIQELDLPVIITARTSLGTINHTMLTADCCRARGIRVLGVIFNATAPAPNTMEAEEESVKYLGRHIRCLGRVPYVRTNDRREAAILAAAHIDINKIAEMIEIG